MRRWLLLAVLALLIADASGVTALVEPEACALASAAQSGPDGACPAFCVRCGCCAAPIVHTVRHVLISSVPPIASVPRAADAALPPGNSPNILHVPKVVLA